MKIEDRRVILENEPGYIYLEKKDPRIFYEKVNPVRNSSGALNPAGIILRSNPAAEQRGIISNGVKEGNAQ